MVCSLCLKTEYVITFTGRPGEAGADELAMPDITATVENRATMLSIVKNVAEVVTISFTVYRTS